MTDLDKVVAAAILGRGDGTRFPKLIKDKSVAAQLDGTPGRDKRAALLSVVNLTTRARAAQLLQTDRIADYLTKESDLLLDPSDDYYMIGLSAAESPEEYPIAPDAPEADWDHSVKEIRRFATGFLDGYEGPVK